MKIQISYFCHLSLSVSLPHSVSIFGPFRCLSLPNCYSVWKPSGELIAYHCLRKLSSERLPEITSFGGDEIRWERNDSVSHIQSTSRVLEQWGSREHNGETSKELEYRERGDEIWAEPMRRNGVESSQSFRRSLLESWCEAHLSEKLKMATLHFSMHCLHPDLDC